MNEKTVSILDGNTFVVTDERGDVTLSPDFPTGLFSFDTRFLSTWLLRVDDAPLNVLSRDDLHFFETRFFLVPGRPTHYVDAKVSVIREQSIGATFVERLTVLNHDVVATTITVRVDMASDFADLFEIKEVQRKRGTTSVHVERDTLRYTYQRGTFRRDTIVTSTAPANVDEGGMTFEIHLEPRGQWHTELQVEPILNGGDAGSPTVWGAYRRRARPQLRQELEHWIDRAPQLYADSEQLKTAYERSLVDLAAMRYASLTATGPIPTAGLPWFMTLFGRDSIFISLQTMPFLPRLTPPVLRLLGSLQGGSLDDLREEEPGKILHEFRYGESAAFEEQPHTPYYGSADATPLFVILLDEYERWSGDADLVRGLERQARAALRWIDEYGDLLGNGYLSYWRRNTRNGLENQCWKDSWDAISYRDGRLSALPRATCELQGYAYDAKIRGARLAREFWHDPAYADQLERQAAELKARFNRDFWVADGEYYALALDPDGTPVDALASNMGHLLWSGIVEPSRARKVADHLLGPAMFSGWGVRTLAETEARYNPVGYHVGTVWPFDNSIIAWGLRRYGFADEAARIAEGMIEASEYFDGRLPEAFAGYRRDLTGYPVEYPTACSPQGWSAGAVLLLLRTMLGLTPYHDHLGVDPCLPSSITRIELLDVPGRWGRADALGRRAEHRRRHHTRLLARLGHGENR
ncbi:glycogen debranching N-terminal domain-containing protein [Solwaraspora sp. WMMD791]|uniref:amylo-alpha-1,6-glucosidase n=1 Tax=Solwaraspora sp. WMMD791 TaxID=3016086 RepID=UPI00249C231B|nr:glycogen debranching N-terminal domain-containing protein [Solwaraspora sp. WMMD791]WFE28701.1 glycogen debranching N-terminal domain-containing protein [Solwaraspora sp. WMMD791]